MISCIGKRNNGAATTPFMSVHPIGVTIQLQVMSAFRSQERSESIHGQTCFTNDRTQCPSGYFSMIGNDNTAIRCSTEPQDHVATSLTIEFIADLSQCVGNIPSGDNRERTQILISTTSSVIAGGIGSPWASRLEM